MTKEGFTSINVIIDRSSSMSHLTAETISNFNKFLAEQKAEPGEATFTLCTFSTDHTLVHDCLALNLVPELNNETYVARGSTALYDALGDTINAVGARLAAMPEEERPSKVIFLIITDGEENSSRRFTNAQVKSMVSHQRDKYKWEFVFMGANIDSIAAGASIGVSVQNTFNYISDSTGTKQLYSEISSNMRSYRRSKNAQVNFFNQTPDDTAASSDDSLAQVDKKA